MKFIFVSVTTLWVLSTAAHVGMPSFERYLKSQHYGPTIHFYTKEAYDNCAAQSAEVKRRGSNHWVCHDPKRHDGDSRGSDA